MGSAGAGVGRVVRVRARVGVGFGSELGSVRVGLGSELGSGSASRCARLNSRCARCVRCQAPVAATRRARQLPALVPSTVETAVTLAAAKFVLAVASAQSGHRRGATFARTRLRRLLRRARSFTMASLACPRALAPRRRRLCRGATRSLTINPHAALALLLRSGPCRACGVPHRVPQLVCSGCFQRRFFRRAVRARG